MGGESIDEGNAIATDVAGNVYLTGIYRNTVDFAPGVSTLELTSNGDNDIFVQKLNTAGNLIWIKSIGASSWGRSNAITVDENGQIYMTGIFTWTVDFDPSDLIYNIASNGFQDVFTLKLNQGIVGVKNNERFNEVSIFPNPTQGSVNITVGNLQKIAVKIFITNGQLIYQKDNIRTSPFQLELAAPVGVYFIESSKGEKPYYRLHKAKLVKM